MYPRADIMTIKHLLDFATRRLSGVPAGRYEAEILLCFALEVSRSFLYANPEMEIPARRQQDFVQLIRRRVRGEPIAYITGHRSFWSLELEVSPDVLIPRPETELVVETALELIPQHGRWRVADLGTGSGAIALALAQERPQCEVHATDCSAVALQVARRNAKSHGLDSVSFHLGSWGEPLPLALVGKFDLIVSNPPYVAPNDPHLETGDCRFEPRLALVADNDGMGALTRVAFEALSLLTEEGYVVLEHGRDQADTVRGMLSGFGYTGAQSRVDLAGIERISWAQKPKQTGVLPVCW